MRLPLLLVLLIPVAVYANDSLGLPELAIPADNSQSAEKIQLGKDLFNDTRFSLDGSISCASCHLPDCAFSDGLPQAKGVNNQTGHRNTPTILNAAFFEHTFLDGRADSLEQQALGPILNPVEHGIKDKQAIVQILLQDEDYKRRLQKVFNISEDEISANHLAKAIASYERTLIAGNSAFDRYYFGRDRSQLSASAARGLLIFRRKGNCANCHEISMKHALFTDNRFYNIGWGFDKIKSRLDNILIAIKENNLESLDLSTEQKSELGRFNVTGKIQDIGKFRTPTLRNIALTAPYMHDGSVKTLEDIVEYYDKGGEKNRFLDAAIYPLHLTDQEKADLVAFMKSLTSQSYEHLGSTD